MSSRQALGIHGKWQIPTVGAATASGLERLHASPCPMDGACRAPPDADTIGQPNECESHMSLTRDEFRKKLATSAGRTELGVSLSAEQAAEILADDVLVDSWYRRSTSVPHAAPPTVQAKSAPQKTTAVRPKQPTFADAAARTVGRSIRKTMNWMRATTRKQRLAAGVIAGGLVLVIVGTTVTVNLVADAQRSAEIQAAEQERIAANEAAAVEELDAEHENADELIQAEKAFVDSEPDWADPELFADLKNAYRDLIAANGRDDIKEIRDGITDFRVAKSKVGTEEEAIAAREAEAAAAEAKRFRDAVIAAGGNPPSSQTDEALVTNNQEWCTRLMNQVPSAPGVVIGELRTAPAERHVAIQFFCPTLQELANQAQFAFADGNHVVGDAPGSNGAIAAGVYRTFGAVSDCYWERHTGGGEILDNDFITHAPDGVQVTAYAGEGLSTQGCGLWMKVG